MSTPTPQPPESEFAPAPAEPAPLLEVPLGPTCVACGAQAVVQWQRRPTDEELADLVAAEMARREQTLLLADPQLPEPSFGPLPTAEDTKRSVTACAGHAITLDGASRIHASSCTAPNDADLPDCDCTPEVLPEPEPAETSGPVLPGHWVTGDV